MTVLACAPWLALAGVAILLAFFAYIWGYEDGLERRGGEPQQFDEGRDA